MNNYPLLPIKILQKLHSKLFRDKLKKPNCEQDPEKASQLIYDALTSEDACMIARFGSTELTCLSNYLGVKNNKGEYLNYIKGNTQAWWWEKNIINQMQRMEWFLPCKRR